jgi:hypothetical protein
MKMFTRIEDVIYFVVFVLLTYVELKRDENETLSFMIMSHENDKENVTKSALSNSGC